jgi:hypothetical protein
MDFRFTPSVRFPAAAALLATLLVFAGCKSAPKVDDSQLEQAGMYFNNIAQLRALDLRQEEIGQLAQARQAGLTDEDCVALIQLARRHGQPFKEGDAIAGLMGTGFPEPAIMTLARLDQLSIAGEAQVMKLAGLSDDVILALAHRRSVGQPALSSSKVAELRNVQWTNSQILDAVDRGYTDAQADAIIASHNRSAKGFVSQRGLRNRR